MMCPAFDNPANYEIRALIRFLHAKIMRAAEIHRELCPVYGQNMSEETMRQWCRMFTDRRRNIHEEKRSVRASVVIDDFARSERGRFTVSEVSCVSTKFHPLASD
jgi:hypothetical protein